MSRSPRGLAVLAALPLAVALPGCGGRSPSDTVKQFSTALADGDGAQACELIVKKARGSQCEQRAKLASDAIGLRKGAKDKLKNIQTSGEKIMGARASVAVKSIDNGRPSTLMLQKEDGEWRLGQGFAS